MFVVNVSVNNSSLRVNKSAFKISGLTRPCLICISDISDSDNAALMLTETALKFR
jgi:hypothetical protein